VGKVSFDISMSLDGFITGPNVGVDNPLGDDGERLHDWMFGARTETDGEVLEEIYAEPGALLIGKRMFDVGVGPWGDPPPFRRQVFVLTHEPREPLPRQGGTTYTFVTGGIQAALDVARAAAENGVVSIWGGANIMGQYLAAGLLDELQIHLIPIILGGGTSLFQGSERVRLQRTRTIDTPAATHLRFRVIR
jgi:dihydrofolate reductase